MNYIALATLFVLFMIGCAFDAPKPAKDQKLVSEITGILDAIEKEPMSKRFFGYPGTLISSGGDPTYEIIAQETEVRVLIANPDISLPIMFERFGKIPKTSSALALYFIVFGRTKSAEAIPYIVNSLQFVHDQKDVRIGLNIAYPALYAAKKITNISDPSFYADIFFKEEFADKQLEIINKLRQWYEEYKKAKK